MMYEFPLFINGADVEGDGWTYVVRASELIKDPTAAFNLKRGLELGRHSGEIIPNSVVGRCAWAGRELCRTALDAAFRAKDAFSVIPLEARLEMIRRVHRSLIANVDTLIDLLIVEGHPRRLAQWELGGVIRGCDDDTLRWYASQFKYTSEASNQTERVQLVRKPDGVVCVNPPQNAAGSNGSLGTLALLAGNTIVVKAPRSTPLTVTYFYRNIVAPALESIGAPAGALNIVSGDSQQIMRDWIASPYVDDVLFFGGSDVGLKVGHDCVAAHKKPILELAGNDGVVIWNDADIAGAAEALAECFYGSAQICMVPKYALVHPDVADELIAAVLQRAANIRPGYPESSETLLSPVLKADQFFDYLAQAAQSGAKILCGGERIGVDGVRSDSGLFLEPTIIRIDGLDQGRNLSCVREETFFPMLPIVVAKPDDSAAMLDDMIKFINSNHYGLRNSLWTGSDRVAATFVDSVHNGGQIKINTSHIGFHPELATHGGTGRTGGPFGELNYIALRTSHLQGIVWGNGEVRPIDDVIDANSRPVLAA
jgi:acyl-CoA reductase-like NAD-dependent aldehyde dehydrogenase